MQTRHYHVISGDHEAMPDHNVIYRNKRHAQTAMVDWKRQCEEAAFQAMAALARPERAEIIAEAGGGATPTFTGTARDGYYEGNYPTSIAGVEYIELTTCYEPECLEGLDDALASTVRRAAD